MGKRIARQVAAEEGPREPHVCISCRDTKAQTTILGPKIGGKSDQKLGKRKRKQQKRDQESKNQQRKERDEARGGEV